MRAGRSSTKRTEEGKAESKDHTEQNQRSEAQGEDTPALYTRSASGNVFSAGGVYG